MNRTFLIFLMIGTALLIAVIGGKPPPSLPGYMPWEVKILPGGKTRVFGITLNKTRIQDANQILSSFPRNQLITEPETLRGLYAVYDEVNLGGFLAQLALQYDIDMEMIRQLYPDSAPGNHTGYIQLAESLQLDLLNSRVRRIIYTPEVDYTPELILQRFGQATERRQLEDGRQHWQYDEMGLNIYIDPEGPEKFVYRPLPPVDVEAPPPSQSEAERAPTAVEQESVTGVD